MLRSRKAQSTLEYAIVFLVIVAAIIFFANNVMKKKVQDSMEHVANEMESKVKTIDMGGN